MPPNEGKDTLSPEVHEYDEYPGAVCPYEEEVDHDPPHISTDVAEL